MTSNYKFKNRNHTTEGKEKMGEISLKNWQRDDYRLAQKY